jgi:hypothetical protein
VSLYRNTGIFSSAADGPADEYLRYKLVQNGGDTNQP